MTHHTTTYNNSGNTFLPLGEVRRVFRRVFLLLIMMVMGVGSAWAQAPTFDRWDGTVPGIPANTNKATVNAAGIEGDGTSDSPYLIKNAKDFAFFWAASYNGKITSSTQYWRLEANIDLDNQSWATYIEKNGTFKGKFDGNNKIIKNMTLAPSKANLNYGLFCMVEGQAADNRAEVKNLTIDNSTIALGVDLAGNTGVGFAVGKSNKYADIVNVKVTNSTITYAKNISGNQYVGGIVGQTNTDTKVQDCSVTTLAITTNGTTTNAYFGGLIGHVNSQTAVTNCSTSDVTITYNTIANASRIAGLIGYTKGAANAPIKINGCSVTNTKVDLKAGINNSSYIGALVAQTQDNTQIGDGTDENKNTVTSPDINIGGDIKAVSYIGGAIGDLAGATDETKTSVVKKLTVTSPSITINNYSSGTSLTGGVFGRVSTFTAVDGVTLTGTSMSFTKDILVAQQIGTFAGTITGSAAQQVSVTNITIDKSDLTFGVDDNSNTVGVRAGVIGHLTSNILLGNWTVSGISKITVNGNLATTGCRLGGFVGSVEPGDAINNKVSFNTIKTSDATTIDITGSVTAASYIGGFVGYAIGRSKDNSDVTMEGISLKTSDITIGGSVTAGSYIGGLAGQMTVACKLKNWKIATSATIKVSEINTATSYVGGAIGNINGASGYNSSLEELTVGAPSVTVNKVSYKDCYIGAVFGRINTYCDVIKTINVSNPTLTYKYTDNTINVAINLGTLAGGIFGVAAQKLDMTGVTVTGNAQLTVGDAANAATNNICQIKAGIIGQSNTNVNLDSWNINSSAVTINGSLTSSGSQIGGFAGNLVPQDANDAQYWTNEITLTTSTINVTGNISVASYLAGFVGYFQGRSKTGSSNNSTAITIGTSSITVGGNVTVGSYLGGFAGLVNQGCNLDKWNCTDATISVNGDVTAASFIGGALGSLTAAASYPTEAKSFTLGNATVTLGTNTSNQIIGSKIGLVGQASTNASLNTWTVTGNNSININSYFTSTASHVGGFIGYMESKASAPTTASNINLGENNSIVANGNITGTVYIGGAFGNLTGVATEPAIVSSFNLSQPTLTLNGDVTGTLNLGGLVGYMTIATLKESMVTDADIVLNGNNTNNMYVGGAVGYMTQTVAPFATVEKVTVKDSKIRTSGTHTYAKDGKPLVVGGLIGHMAQEATKFTDVHNCVVDNIDINLSGFIPEAANTSGNLYNQQQNAFVVGGVIGRINTPSRLPEYLYFSGKINAPFAMVAPVVGVFLTNIKSENYAFDDYTGANAPNVTNQWQKALTWFYTDYNLGLSQSVRTQTDRTRNYTASTTNIGGVEYLNIQSNTLLEYNGLGNISKTVLRYDISGTNRDFGLFPKWNTNSATYPEYYMYYMQGVNRGKYVESGMAEAAKSIVLNGLLYTLEFSQSAERSFAKTFTVSSTERMDSYEWYINGEKQSETSNQYTTVMTIEQVTDPNTSIYVYGVKDEKKVAMTTGVPSRVLLRVKDESKAITTYGTMDNPYLIGGTYGAQELQLLSFLSTLDNNIKWEGDFISSTHYNRAYYELESDIDLSGIAEFTPISLPKSNNTDGTSSGYHQNFVFDGVFEGNHHTISGLNIGWYAGALNTNDQNMGWGLFAAVGNPTAQKKVGDATASNAVIQNLIIDGATLTHRTDNTSFYYNNGVSGNANYCMVGVLAGIVSNNVTIQDIEIRNSKITDEGSRNYSLATKGLYVGGAIGSYQTGFNATNNAQVNSRIQHIAAQVDITLTRPQIADVSAVTQLSQFNVGGIIGRYIATSATKDQAEAAMPKYTIYSGVVKTPRAWVSPVLGALRYKDQQATNDWKNYSKQYEGNNNTDATQIHITDALYYNFYIDTDKITDAFPTNTCKRGSRTLSEHVDIVESAIMYNALKYQGVNYEAKYIDMEGASLEYLNENRTGDYNWLWDDGFVHLSTDPYVEARISRDGNSFTASLVGADAVSYTWKLSFDGETWHDIPDETNATYTAQESPKQKFIRAFVSDGTKEYPTLSMLVEAVAICAPTITYTDDASYRTYTANLNVVDGIDTSHLEIEYQWYDWNHDLIPGATAPTYKLSMDEVNQHHEVVWCVVTIKEIGMTMAEYTLMAGGTVVYIDGTNGIDNVDGSTERGWTDSTPVKTIDHANSLLKSKAEGGTMDNNIIVVMGTLNPNPANFSKRDDYTNPFRSHGNNPATLTGYYGKDYHGEIIICEKWIQESSVNAFRTGDGHNCYVLGDTKFENLVLRGSTSIGNNFIECHGNDVTFGKGLVMKSFNNLSVGHGNLNTAQTVPELTIILTATNLDEEAIEEYTKRTKPQVVTFQSGHYGRVMGGRYTQGFFKSADNTSHTILGSAEHPVWAVVNIEFDEDNEMTDGGSTTYTCDINCVIAGLTDGSMYGDYEINHYGGRVCYIVGGNQGNPVPNGTAEFKNVGVDDDEFEKAWGQWPNASYFGRSVINIDQREGLKNITIDNIYAGGLGRQANGDNATSIVDMYVYGQTEVNIKGGTVNSCVYAGGAGGVLGQNPWDAHTPYATTEPDDADAGIMNGVQYGDTRVGTWSSKTADATLATVILHNRLEDGTYEEFPLNLANSSATINISGGSVNGDVYGGGFGQVEDMPAAVTMQGVGSVFGKTYINISGGTITGSVYGGSRGSSVYYHEVNKYGQTIDHIAEMNGTINLTISGTEDKYPYIKSAIYGAGRGLSTAPRKATQADVDAGKADNVGDTYTEEYPRIATAGNTDLGDGYRTNVNITINLPESVPFPNDIYGGGQIGLVDGDINIVLKRGTLTGNIYGGGYGEQEHLDKAKVTGNTRISTGAVDVDDVDQNIPVTISGGVNIYGGGDMAQVKGNTFINLNHGNITANVFGGGRGLTQSDSGTFTDYGKVTGNTRVWINNQTPYNLLTGNIYGGGALGAVQGNTTVVVKAGEVEGNVFGGGKGEEGSEKAKVTGNTNVIVNSGWTEP